MCLGFVTNYAGFVAVRALLGIAEGGLLPGMVWSCDRLFIDFCLMGYRCCTCLVSIVAETLPCALVCFTLLPPCRAPLAVSSESGYCGRTKLIRIGLLARGLAMIGTRGGLEGWRWILIIEGLLVCLHGKTGVKWNITDRNRHLPAVL